MLFLLIFVLSVALVNVRFETRALHADLAKAKAEGRNLRRENRRLQIELTTVADLRDVHSYSVEHFGMTFPSAADRTLILLRPGR